LLVLAIIAGSFKMTYFQLVMNLLPATQYHVHDHTTFWIMTIGTQLFVIAAILFAYKKYSNWSSVPDGSSAMEKSFFYKLLWNQYYIPKMYEEIFAKPYAELSRIAWKQIDLKIVDATVDAIANGIYKTGENTRDIQNGNLSTMLRWMVVGLVVLSILAVAFTVGYNVVGA
jgi:NADH-quinone oxidoreductase subunit L